MQDTSPPKTTPRLVLRGRIDLLHAFVMLASAKARGSQMSALASYDTLAAYCREIMSAEYNLRSPAPLTLLGKSEEKSCMRSRTGPTVTLEFNTLSPGRMTTKSCTG